MDGQPEPLRTSGDTLRFNDTAEALEVEAELAPTSYGRDAAISLARGDVSGMSFSFEVGDEEWRERPDGTWDRTILQIRRLWDVAIVTYPAYEATSAALWLDVAAGDFSAAPDPEVIAAIRAHVGGAGDAAANTSRLAEAFRRFADTLEAD